MYVQNGVTLQKYYSKNLGNIKRENNICSAIIKMYHQALSYISISIGVQMA